MRDVVTKYQDNAPVREPRGYLALNSSLIDNQRAEMRAEIERVVRQRSPVYIQSEEERS